jgi:hypothetical protein
MLNREILIKRLSLIKYLYQIGIEQSRQSETIASFSILSFHDSIEMFLKLLAEHKNIRSDKLNFLEYWTKIPSLTLKETMRNLNSRRVNIKHKGLLPSKSDIEISRVNAMDFFEQNTILQFDIDFKHISLLDLVLYKEVKDNLIIACKSLESNEIQKCIEHSALAFDDLIHSYEVSKETYFGKSPFYFGKNLSFLSSFHIGIGNEFEGRKGKKLDDFIDRVKESLEGLQNAVKILSFGIDYKKYSKFKLLTPIVTRFIGGQRIAEIYGEKKWTKENCQFCIDFVIESSLKLQEFDFDISEIMDNKLPNVIINKKPVHNKA